MIVCFECGVYIEETSGSDLIACDHKKYTYDKRKFDREGLKQDLERLD